MGKKNIKWGEIMDFEVLSIETAQKLVRLEKENNRLLELCMYALISSTKIYELELANDTKQSFISIIKNNLDDDTYTLREKIKDCWKK